MKSPHGFIKTAGRGSAYCTKGGAFWIVKVQSKWHLVQMGNKSKGVEQCTVGRFKTLTDAAQHYRELTN
jgi:hypothetical protein